LKRTIADDALVEPHPGVEPLSTTVTFQPRRLSSSAIELPMIPAPMTMADDGAVVTKTPQGVWTQLHRDIIINSRPTAPEQLI
jgi:hypothetical protein